MATNPKSAGNGVQVSKTLGFLLTDFQMSTSGVDTVFSVSKDAVAKAKRTWDSYLKSSTWPAIGQGDIVGVAYPSRVTDAAYYFALEYIAEEYIRLRIGNVGSTGALGIVEKIMAKANALLAVAKDGIARYEQWCASEAAIVGANTIEMMNDAVTATYSGSEEAMIRWRSAVSDLDSELDNIAGLDSKFQDMIRQAAYGFSLRLFGGKLTQRKLGFSAARNPAIAAYYNQQAGVLISLGDKLVNEYMQWLAETKQVLLTVLSYKKRDNAYGVMTLSAQIIPSASESLFRVRSLVTAMPVTVDDETQEAFIILHSGFGTELIVYWYNKTAGTYGFRVKAVTEDGILAPDMAVIPACPGPGIHRAELVIVDKVSGAKVSSHTMYVNIEWPVYESTYGCVTLRGLRASIGRLLPTSPSLAKIGQLEFDDAMLCEAAFLACDDWNTRMPDFQRKVTPAMYPETSLLRQGIFAHAMRIKGAAMSLSAMAVVDVKAGNVHNFEQQRAKQFIEMGESLYKRYVDDIIRTQRRIWNHGSLR